MTTSIIDSLLAFIAFTSIDNLDSLEMQIHIVPKRITVSNIHNISQT